jgi:putative transcriptional regulator
MQRFEIQKRKGKIMFNMAIYNRLKILIAEKELRENRKLTYRAISQETGISTTTLVLYMRQGVGAFDTGTLETLCNYLNCQPGDLIIYSASPPEVAKKK